MVLFGDALEDRARGLAQVFVLARRLQALDEAVEERLPAPGPQVLERARHEPAQRERSHESLPIEEREPERADARGRLRPVREEVRCERLREPVFLPLRGERRVFLSVSLALVM